MFYFKHFLSFCFLYFSIVCFSYTNPAEKNICEISKQNFYSFSGIPAFNYSSDDGVGFGFVGSMYKKNGIVKPYIFALDLQLFMTSKWVHYHYLRADFINVFDLPLRLRAKTGFDATITANYCGKGMLANCYANIDKLGFAEQEKHNYFLYRYFEIYGLVEGRYKLKELPHKIELIASYRGSYYLPGTWGNLTPYPKSMYVDEIETVNRDKGFAGVIEAGVMFDDRDNEPAPTKGYWFETTFREASPYWGSKWSYIGFNLSLRGYLPLTPQRKLVLAAQGIFDGMVGDAPLQEIVRVGGTLYGTAYGGGMFGRGIRAQYFPGKVKLIKQLELRYQFWNFNLFKQNFDLTAVSFIDFGLVAWQLGDLEKNPFKPLVGFGGGLRLVWNESFIVRFDLGLSPIEKYTPRFYIKIGNVF